MIRVVLGKDGKDGPGAESLATMMLNHFCDGAVPSAETGFEYCNEDIQFDTLCVVLVTKPVTQ